MKLKQILLELELNTNGGDGNIDKLINAIRAMGYISPFDRSATVIEDMMMMISVSKFDGNFYLDSLTSMDKGKGNASTLLKMVLKLADKYGVEIVLTPKPYGNSTMSQSQLTSWYKRYGFVERPDYIEDLIYYPK